MYIAIKNLNGVIIDSANLDTIKTLNGEFTRDMLESQLSNFIYSKAIIDITAIKNYFDIKEVLNFLSFFPASKVIILLNDSELVSSNNYLRYLVENGYYNFTRNAAGINYLLNHPNTLENVKKYLSESSYTSSGTINPNVGVSPNAYGNQSYNQSYVANTNTNVNTINDEYKPAFTNPNVYSNVGYIKEEEQIKVRARIIGLQNVTEHAGATTLMHMMLKQLKANYKVIAFEMFKQDSIYFNDPDISFCTSVEELRFKINALRNIDIVLIDLNDLPEKQLCTDILYLANPGTISLNKALKKDNNLREKVKDGKIILNQSAIKDEELSNFEYETKFKVFYNMPVINDRADRLLAVDKLLVKLGFNRQEVGGIFGIFK